MCMSESPTVVTLLTDVSGSIGGSTTSLASKDSSQSQSTIDSQDPPPLPPRKVRYNGIILLIFCYNRLLCNYLLFLRLFSSVLVSS